jgi:hypothetical protein
MNFGFEVSLLLENNGGSCNAILRLKALGSSGGGG